MKKITLSVAALALAMNSYAQNVYLDTTIRVNITERAKIAKNNHENLYQIVTRAEDMITMLNKDTFDGHIKEYYTLYYKDLLKDIIELASTVEVNAKLEE
tara:strand:+ start:190 stop:489 length:300 start_codon:yes stop_codon:yes gene_type:complete